jgi:hypothetical protein
MFNVTFGVIKLNIAIGSFAGRCPNLTAFRAILDALASALDVAACGRRYECNCSDSSVAIEVVAADSWCESAEDGRAKLMELLRDAVGEGAIVSTVAPMRAEAAE